MYFMLILVSGAKMQLPLQLGVTDRLTDSTTTVTLCACALRVNYDIKQYVKTDTACKQVITTATS